MAAAHVQSGSSGANGTTTPSHTLAGAPTQGNLLVAGVVTGASSGGFTAANGYTKRDGPGSQEAYFYKIAGAAEPAAQAPCTLGTARDWRCTVAEYSLAGAVARLDATAATSDSTSPQNQAAIDPTDSIDTIMIGFATNDVARTYTSQTIGGVAATERVDASQNGNASITLFDRLNVNTSTSTFAAEATASGVPSNGAIALLVFQLQGPIVAAGTITGAGGLVKQVNTSMAGSVASAGALVTALVFFLVAAGALASAGALALLRTISLAGTIALAGGLVRSVSKVLAGVIALAGALVTYRLGGPGSAVANDAARGSATASDALRGSVTAAEDGGD